VFPEGRIRKESESVVRGGRFRPTLVRLAKLANVPIVPAVVLGADQYNRVLSWAPLMRTKYGVIYGEPFRVDDEEQGEQKLAHDFQGLCAELKKAMGRD
jgi:1-acyl-sn-glycerol-3-phosphate acyltransferase